jgi:hypothetical protein
MKTLIKYEKDVASFEWINFDFFPKSNGIGKEIYLKNEENSIEDLIILFYAMFGSLKEEIIIYNKSWWDFCITTWNPENGEYNYEIYNKPEETRQYLKLLAQSEIEKKYNGFCSCVDWDKFLFIILKCITTHQAPYSPIFCDIKNNFFFYFHYSGSIGLYYNKYDSRIEKLLKIAEENYPLS